MDSNFICAQELQPGDLFKFDGSLSLSVYVENKNGKFTQADTASRVCDNVETALMFIQRENNENFYLIFYCFKYNCYTCFHSDNLTRIKRI